MVLGNRTTMTDDAKQANPTPEKKRDAAAHDHADDHADDLEKLDPEKLVEDALEYFSQPYPADQPPVHP